jgi:hypothetical protein
VRGSLQTTWLVILTPHTSAHADNRQQSFEHQALDAGIEFGENQNDITNIEGRDQLIYWKGCVAITIIDDHTNTVLEVMKGHNLTGQGKLAKGLTAVFVEGQLKEGLLS